MTIGGLRKIVEDLYDEFGDEEYIDSLPIYVHVRHPKSIDQVMREAAGESEPTQEVAYPVKSAGTLPDETFVIKLEDEHL
jgi:hypothetical protein